MFKLGALIAAALMGYIFYQNVPDLRRYMRIRAM
jgi:hypothetical protein